MTLTVRIRILWITVLLSLLLHIGGGWWIFHAWQRHLHDQAMEVYVADAPMQIVDLVARPNQMRPDRARFVGTADNAVREETVARPVVPKRPTRAQAASESDPAAALPKRPVDAPAARGTMQAPALKRRAMPLSTALVERLDGGGLAALPDDYFPDYRRGRFTYVNVLRHPHIGYFVELKRALKIAWNPVAPLRLQSPTVFAGRSVIRVVVGVAVDDGGALSELFVLRGSGIADYDREALRTFRATFPFFAPSAEALALDGTTDRSLHMSWSFEVYI